MVTSHSLLTTSHPWKGRGQGHVTHLEFYTPGNISAKATASDFKFLHMSWPREGLAKWAYQGLMTHFYILGQGHIFGADEARHFKFGLQIERKEYCYYTY